jgi:hypothetical protein
VLADNLAFTGTDGSMAAAVASRILANTAPSLVDGPSIATVRAGVEVRASGALTLASEWQGSAGQSPVLGSPAITLRAAADLLIQHSLSTGLAPVKAEAGAALAPLIGGTASAGALRLTAGADLASALPSATVAGGTGKLVIGRAAPSDFEVAPAVAVASSTGRIELAAAGDVQLLNNRVAVYTTGLPAGTSAGLDGRLATLPAEALRGPDGATLETPFLAGGGSVSVKAGQDVIGAPAATPYITDWWWSTESGVWYARYQDRYATGFATFGGGDLRVQAGRDAIDVNATASNSGYAGFSATGVTTPAVVYGGGSVRLSSGRNIGSGLLSASGPSLVVRAGAAIQPSGNAGGYAALQLDYQQTAVRVEAAGAVTIGAVRSAGRLDKAFENDEASGTTLAGLDSHASLLAASWGGKLNYLDSRAGGSQRPATSAVARVMPSDARFFAPSGSISLGGTGGGITQQPVSGQPAALTVLAQDAVQLASVLVQPALPDGGVTVRSNVQDAVSALSAQTEATAADAQALSPVQVVAASGDLTLAAPLQSARPVRLLAGRDLLLPNPGGVLVSHAEVAGQPGAVSLLDAGRDIVVSSTQRLPFGTLVVRGAGDLVLRAGRNMDLGVSEGVVSRGNLDDSLGLVSGGANLTLLIGTQRLSADYTQAATRGFAVLGGAGVASHAGELAVLLQAMAAGSTVPATGSAAATAFDALAPAEQLTQAAAVLGSARSDAALIAQIQALNNKAAALTPAAARAAFAALATADQARVVGGVLATGFDTLAASTRIAFITRLADPASAAAMQLKTFVQARTGIALADPAQTDPAKRDLAKELTKALTAFEALPSEQQALLSDAVLVDALRSAGRAAAELTGDDRYAAYARGYAALQTVFPGVRSAGSLEMSSSQTKTQQGGSITLMAPGGGINAGALAATSATAANTQGIVTVAGGDIQAVVHDDFAVNQSRVFTLAKGNVLLWSSEGNLDAGRGAKTVRGAPKPVYGLDANGNVTVDTSGSFTGSGIAVLDAGSTLDLYAPKGEINAGEAGIKSAGNAFFGANRIVGGDNLVVGGDGRGTPPPPSDTGATAGLAAASQSATAKPATADKSNDDEDERKKRKRRNLFLDFLGFGRGD